MPLLNALLRIGATPRVVIDYIQTGAAFLAAAWLVIVVSVVIGEAIVASERLTSRSLDSQLIRLGTRLVGLVAAVAILIEGGDELGFPAYSVLAGLGVGGLAVALAARDTIANLIGSLLITIEKPFRVGHVVRIGGSEGTVEDVGFRSTRIRTPDNSLVTIPSSAVVNTTVENLSIRTKRRQRFFVQVMYDTPREKVEEIVARIRQLIVDHPLAEESTCQVRFNNFAESSLDILVIFNLMVEDYASELREREAVLLQIMDLVKDAGVEFAFPTRTLYIENGTGGSTARPASDRMVERIRRPILSGEAEKRLPDGTAGAQVPSNPPRRKDPRMNGAESLVHTLLKSGVDTCFCNPGTSEMHFVAALDRVPGMRCVLGLFEGVVTGAADGYARMSGKPAATLLHCGPGPREWAGQPAQRSPRADADRQHRRRPGDLSPPERRTADRGHRGLGARRVGLGAYRHVVRHGGRRCRRGGAGRAHPSWPDRHADPAVGHIVGRGRRDRRGAAGAAEAAL